MSPVRTPEEAPRRATLPPWIAPMLARPGVLPADEAAWAFEVKWDGIRAIARVGGGTLRLASRTGNDVTAGYPELHGLADALDEHAAVLDGEIVAFDDRGRPSFQALQPRIHRRGADVAQRAAARPVTLMLFDLLWLDGEPLDELPYRERRERLGALELDGPAWQVPPAYPGQGTALLRATEEQGMEGVMAKRLDAPYWPGRRTDSWRKIKHEQRQELVIGGWRPGQGGRRGTLGSLQVGVHGPDGKLRHAGGVGTGFSDDELRSLTATLRGLERKTSPFAGHQPPADTRFVTPKLVCEARFAEWTSDGLLRQAAYLGLRDDKPAADVVREVPVGTDGADAPERPSAPSTRTGRARGRRSAASSDADASVPDAEEVAGRIPAAGDVTVEVAGRALALTNLDKVLYPATGTTKADVLRYYARIAPVLLPHLHDHPVTLKRYPDGVDGPSFFQKHADRHRPDWVATHPVPSRGKRGTIDYVLVQDEPTLLWAANLAALELHPSLSRTAAPTGVGDPVALVFDLDPGPGTTIVECCTVALAIRALLAELHLRACAKTSGSKGLQVYVPLGTGTPYERSKPFARAVASLLEERRPELVVSRMAKKLRRGKVLIDWSQNDPHKTTVAVYALRARKRPTVSTPVGWDEVQDCAQREDPERLVFLAPQTLERVAAHGDRFAAVREDHQRLPELRG